MNTKTISPGSYKLKEDVHNDEHDKRKKRDWRYLPLFENGAEFVVSDYGHKGCAIAMVECYAHNFVYPGFSSLYEKLLECLVPCEKASINSCYA